MELGKNLKLLIFDFDGTLHNLGIDWQEVRQAVGIAGTNEALGDAIDRFKRENNQKSLQLITKLETDVAKDQIISSKTVEALKELQKKYKLAIFSRNSRHVIEILLKQSGLESVYIVGREDAQKVKPDIEGLKRILAHFKVKIDQALVIGDTYHDVLAAGSAGMPSVIIGKNYQNPIGQNKQPDYRLQTIEELVPLLEG